MLLFTNSQESAVNAARSHFNQTQTALAGQATLVGNAATVPLDAWRRIDARGVAIQRDVLAVFNALAQSNSTPVGIGDLVNFYPQVGDSGDVHVSMDGRSDGNADQAAIKYEGTPVPVFDSFARFGWRQMEVMRKSPSGIDTDTIANHQRKVAEKLEDMAINGMSSIKVNGSSIYGLRTFPNRSTATHGLDLNGATGAQWVEVIKKLVNTLISDNAFGRATIFMNWGDYTYISMTEFAAGYPKTILQRLREIEQIAAIIPASRVPANELPAIANMATGEWGSILNGMPLVTRPKARQNPEDDYVFGVMAATAPQFRSDYDGRSQIAHITKV